MYIYIDTRIRWLPTSSFTSHYPTLFRQFVLLSVFPTHLYLQE